MFDPTSRYYNINTRILNTLDIDRNPREIAFVKRRFIPFAEGSTTLLEHTVTEGDRLDNITAKYIGDPTQFWRICDANNAMRPEELTETIGQRIKIALGRL